MQAPAAPRLIEGGIPTEDTVAHVLVAKYADHLPLYRQAQIYARDDRPWGGTEPPGVAYLYAPDRKAEQPLRHLAGFAGMLQVDGYAGYKALASRNAVSLAFCWAHVRGSSSSLLMPVPRRLRQRRSRALPNSTGSRERSAAERRGAPRATAGKEPTHRQRTRALAEREARAHQPEEQAGGGHPLRPLALGWPLPLP